MHHYKKLEGIRKKMEHFYFYSKHPLSKLKTILTVIILLLFFTLVNAEPPPGKFYQFYGKNPRDIELAKKVYETGKDIGVTGVEVYESVMYIHVTMECYQALYHNRPVGNQYMRTWQRIISKHYTGQEGGAGYIGLKVGKDVVAECSGAGFLGTEIRVKWFDDRIG